MLTEVQDGRGWVVPPPLAGASGRPGRSQLSRCMELPAPWCRTFREIFLHPKVLGCMQDTISNGFNGGGGIRRRQGEWRTRCDGVDQRGGRHRRGGTTLTEEGQHVPLPNGEMWNSVMSGAGRVGAVREAGELGGVLGRQPFSPEAIDGAQGPP